LQWDHGIKDGPSIGSGSPTPLDTGQLDSRTATLRDRRDESRGDRSESALRNPGPANGLITRGAPIRAMSIRRTEKPTRLGAILVRQNDLGSQEHFFIEAPVVTVESRFNWLPEGSSDITEPLHLDARGPVDDR